MIFKGFGPRKPHHLGLDIGSYAVKIVEVSPEKERFNLRRFGVVTIDDPQDDEKVRQAVRAAAAKTTGESKLVSISVAGPGVIVRSIELPRMTPEELKNAVVFEAEKYIPFKVDEVIIDHQVLVQQLPDNNMLVLLVAAKKDVINRRISLVQGAGLTPNLIDVSSLAMANAFLISGDVAGGRTSALMNVGHRFTDINIISGSTLSFTRSINIGGWDLAKMVADSAGVNTASALKLMRETGDREEAVSAGMKRGMDNIIEEMRLSFSYFENQSDTGIQSVYLSGGCARSGHLASLVKNATGIEPVIWDPAAPMGLDDTVSKEELASVRELLGVSVGLAIRN